jgi:hypothetical protein
MDDRKKHWEDVYTTRSPLTVSWYQDDPTVSLDLIKKSGTKFHAPLIDIGGGASVLVDKLIDIGFRDISVLDIAGNALNHSRNRLGDRADTVLWHEADVTEFVSPQPYALWHDRAVFHFLTQAIQRKAYLGSLVRNLQPDGQARISTFSMNGPKMCSGLAIVQYDEEKICREFGPGFRLLEQREELHTTPGGSTQEFVYFRFKRKSN